MLNQSENFSSGNISGREYEAMLREGMTAARGGSRALAKRLLERATLQNPNDSRPWLWLSATTDNPEEQRTYLERAVAANPYDEAAKRGLLALNGPAVAASTSPPDDAPEPADTETYECPNCGGRMHFDPANGNLVCESCGHTRRPDDRPAPPDDERPLAAALHSGQAHHWAASQQDVACEKCGAHTLEPPGVKTIQCPYCGSNQLIESAETRELVDPQAIALFQVNGDQALQLVRAWLGNNLRKRARGLALRPAYYPFWVFEGVVRFRWSAAALRDVEGGLNGRQVTATTIDGEQVELFSDVLVSGVSALTSKQAASVQPFELAAIPAFDPDHIAGWPALTYDRSLSDASLLAREQVVRRVGSKVRREIASAQGGRYVQLGGGNWSGIAYRQVLLPLWSGSYQHAGQTFPLLINGQTGKVAGTKPKDAGRALLIGLLVGMGLLVAIGLLGWRVVQYWDALLALF